MKPVFVTNVSNVREWMAKFEELRARGAAESCMMLVDGEPGLGKTRTAEWWATQTGAIRVRAKQDWTSTWALKDIYHATTGKVAPARSGDVLFGMALDALGGFQAMAARAKRTPALVIDEADHATGQGGRVLEKIRDLTDITEIATVLVGMDRLDRQLARFPQVGSRIAKRVRFGRLTHDDVRAIVTGVCEVAVADDLVACAFRACGGYVRELKEAIASIERFGKRLGGQAVTVQDMRGQVLLHDRKTNTPVLVG